MLGYAWNVGPRHINRVAGSDDPIITDPGVFAADYPPEPQQGGPGIFSKIFGGVTSVLTAVPSGQGAVGVPSSGVTGILASLPLVGSFFGSQAGRNLVQNAMPQQQAGMSTVTKAALGGAALFVGYKVYKKYAKK